MRGRPSSELRWVASVALFVGVALTERHARADEGAPPAVSDEKEAEPSETPSGSPHGRADGESEGGDEDPEPSPPAAAPPPVPGAPKGLPYDVPGASSRAESPPPDEKAGSARPAGAAPAPSAVPGTPPSGENGATDAASAGASGAPVGGDDGDDDGSPKYSHEGTWLLVEAAAGMNVNGRLSGDAAASHSDDAIDGLLGVGANLAFGGRWSLGLAYQRIGYGKERFAISSDGSVLNVAYDLDTFWALGRYYFSAERPAVYAGLGLGAGLGQAKATGAVSGDALVVASTPFECSRSGGLGFGGLAAIGAEVDLSSALSLLTEIQGTAHAMSRASDAHGRCGTGAGMSIPGAGPSIQGALRFALAYRLPL